MKKRIKVTLVVFIVITLSIVSLTLINTQVIATYRVMAHSMDETLSYGSMVFVNKISYNFENPKQGDIVVINLTNESQSERMVQRVIGVEGQEIDLKDGYVYVDDKKLDEEYIIGDTYPREITFPITVPEGQVFVLGDNRQVSKDSRFYNCIKIEQIEGKVMKK